MEVRCSAAAAAAWLWCIIDMENGMHHQRSHVFVVVEQQTRKLTA